MVQCGKYLTGITISRLIPANVATLFALQSCGCLFHWYVAWYKLFVMQDLHFENIDDAMRHKAHTMIRGRIGVRSIYRAGSLQRNVTFKFIVAGGIGVTHVPFSDTLLSATQRR